MENIDVAPTGQNAPTIIKPPTNFVGMSTSRGLRFFDNSTLETFRVCMRKGYFRHVRHWEPEGVRVPLVFGSSMHSAQDTLWDEACNKKNSNHDLILDMSMDSFEKYWQSKGLEQREELDLYPRTPGRARQILDLYLDRYLDDLLKLNLLAIEVPFVVPLNLDNEDLYYVGKWDKVFERMSGITILDHKTTSSMATTWHNSFQIDGQTEGYQHGGMLTYGERFDMVMIDGLLVQKTNVDVQRIPLKRGEAHLAAWNWEVTELIDQITYNEERLQEYRQGPRLPFLPAFPKCSAACTQYYGTCPYIDLCKFWDNPEDHQTPDFFLESKWAPFDIQEKLDGTFDIKIKEESD